MRFAISALLLVGCSAPEPGRPPLRTPPENAVGGFHIDLPARAMAPGEEVQTCYIFPMAIEGPSHIVGGATLTVGGGMHHGNITARIKTGEGFRECPAEPVNTQFGGEAFDVANGGAVLFGSSTQVVGQEWQSFPSGMGYRIRDDYEIVARMHYLNATSQPVTVAPRYQWYTISEQGLTQELAPFAWHMKNFTIPPLARQTVMADCLLPGPMHVVAAMPHMHRMGVEFAAGYSGGKRNGESWLSSKGYDPDQGVMLTYDPAIDLSQSDGAWFSCTWQNALDKPLSEGIGDNEMCILFGYAWPPATAFSALASPQSCLAAARPM